MSGPHQQPQIVYAVLLNSIERVIERLDAGDDKDEIDFTAPWHMTAIMCAAIRNMGPIVELLISHGADLNITSSGEYAGMTSLHFACRNSDNKIIKLLVDAGANLSSLDRDGKNLLHELALMKNLEGIKILATNDIEALKCSRDVEGRLPVDCVSKTFWKAEEMVALLTPKEH